MRNLPASLASVARRSPRMGVKGLQSYVQNRLPLTDYIVELASLRAGAADAVVVDGMALIRKLYEQSRPQWKAAAQRLRPTRPPARPASTRSSSRQPPASASLCQLAASFWLAGHTGLVFRAGRSTG